jgi:hypothetical protein
MLSLRRSIKVNGVEVERTPLLIPSFSSKGFPDVKKIIGYCSELIDGPALVSAYDLHYKKIDPPFNFASLIFLDSGGYEASKETELSDFGSPGHTPQPWDQAKQEAELTRWNASVPSIFISYDHPKERLPIVDQITRAKGMAAGRSDFGREILLKPETAGQTLLKIENVIEHVHALSPFDVIGVTEKEIGNSILDRMHNIAKLRRALSGVGLQTPLHIFGSLDTVTTPLYFLAGADIFDGLTWLRYAYLNGQTIYKHNFGALKFGIGVKSHLVDARCWNENYYYMNDMELEMRRFLNSGDYGVFAYNGELFRKSVESTLEALGN